MLKLTKKLEACRLVIYNYHRLRPDYNGELYRFDEDVFGPSAAIFKMQIRWLKANTRIISENELMDFFERREFPSQICSMITFDDGYIDNYTLAYPILKEENVPAIFFIPTKAIKDRQLGWWDILSYILKNSPIETIEFENKIFSIKVQYSQVKKFFLQKFKLESYEQTKQLLEKLSLLCQVQIPEVRLQDTELMTWEQIIEMSENNIIIGSHTHNHHVLATLNIENQLQEAKTSKSLIENQIGRKVNSISYPVGGYQHFSKDSQRVVKECEYRLAFSFNTGVNYWTRINRYDIKRIAPPDRKSLLAATTILPQVFARNNG
jgi:peptidoglycan/xylan/chitin deacetylase (PgdA/CDA1 family)